MNIATDIPGFVSAGGLDVYVEQLGQGPDVLLIGGLGDTVESWEFQLKGLADRYRLTAFDNGGAGRTAMPDGPVTVSTMADDAAGVLDALGIASAHVAGFSGGSIVAQELAVRRPDLVRSLVLQSTWPVPDVYFRRWLRFVQWLVAAVPDERTFLEYFFLDIYTARAHDDGTVAGFVDDVLAFPHKQAPEDLQRYLDAFIADGRADRPARITAPTLVLAGGVDAAAGTELGRAVAAAVPGAVRGVGDRGPPAVPGGARPLERPGGRLLARGRGAVRDADPPGGQRPPVARPPTGGGPPQVRAQPTRAPSQASRSPVTSSRLVSLKTSCRASG